MILRSITQCLDRIERIITAITGLMIGALALLVGWQVVARYIFASGQFWAEELALVAMMWAALLGAAGCTWTDSHVRLNILVESLPGAARLTLLTLVDGVILWFAFLIVKEGISLVERTMGGKMSALGIPIGTTYLILPVTGGLMMLFILVRAVHRFIKEDGGKKEDS